MARQCHKRVVGFVSAVDDEKKVAVAETPHFYRIGTPGKPWGDAERAAWLADVGVVKRSYADEVLAKLESLKDRFDVMQYGALSQDPSRYPLFCIKTKDFDSNNGKPCVLVTGDVHGYEKSGVQGARHSQPRRWNVLQQSQHHCLRVSHRGVTSVSSVGQP